MADAGRDLAENTTDLERISCFRFCVEFEETFRRIGRPMHFLQRKESDIRSDLLQSDSMVYTIDG